MNIVDANVLLYAVNADSERHEQSRAWLDASLSGGATVGFAWIVLCAFVRLSTKSNLFPHPLSPDDAFDRVDAWLASPAGVVVDPGSFHGRLMRDLLRGVGHGGNLVNDAHLAALAIEQRGRVVSFDSDFDRFDGVGRVEPGAP